MSIPLVPLPMTLGTLTLSTIGLIGNIAILIVTFKNKQLQNRCGFLIGCLAAIDTDICLYLIQLRIMHLNGMYFQSNVQCFYYSIHGLFSLGMQTFIGVCIGFDRLLAVTIPLKYNNFPRSIHILFLLSSIIYGLIITSIGYFNSDPLVIVPVCMPPTAFNNQSRLIWIGTSFILGIFTLFVYALAHYKCSRLKRSVDRSNVRSINRIRRLLNSLTAVVLVYALTWFLTVCALFITQMAARDTSFARTLEQQLVWLVILNASLNVFIYMWRAPEYRKALMNLFPYWRNGRNEISNTNVHNTQFNSVRSTSLCERRKTWKY